MTFAAVGSAVPFTSSTFTLAPSSVGDFILAEVVTLSSSDWAASLSSSNVTWTVLAAPALCPADSFYATVFIGKVTAASSATVTVGFNTGTPTVRGNAMEYSTTAGYSAVTLDSSAVTGAGAGTGYPSLTPGHGAGELYYCYAYNDGNASAGSTSGYTYYVDGNGNGACWNPACTTSAQAPVWADSDNRDGIAVLLYEAVAPPPSSFPATPLDLRCELDLGGTQTDVSSYVYQRQGDSPPVTLTRGRADESGQANPGSGTWEWNNRDGRFSPKNPVSPYYGQLIRNTPVRWSVPAQVNYLRLEADQLSGASCPDAAGLHITGDIDIRLDVKLTSWPPGGAVLAAKWGTSGSFGWIVSLTAAGTVQFFWSTTGSDFPSATSVLPLPVTGRQAVRVTLAVSTGTVTFYTGPAGGADGSTWTQLGTAVVLGSTSIFASTAAIGAGNYATGGTAGMYGNLYELEVRSGIAGTVKAHPVFSSQTAGTTSFTDAESNTWTLTGTAGISSRSYRWHGQMSAQPPKWDVTGRDMAVAATAGGLLRLINQGQAPLMSPVKRAITLLSGAKAPVAYWPMEDAAGATALGSAAGGQPMYFSGSPQLSSNSDFACSAALPVTNSAAFTGRVSYTGTWTDNQCAFLMEIPSGAETDTAVIASLTTGGTVQTLTLRYRTAGAGSLELYGYDSTGTQLFDSGSIGGFAANGKQLLIAISLQNAGGGNITWHVDGWAPGAASPAGLSGSISGTIGAVTRVALNRDGTLTQTVLGHCAVLTAYQQLYNLFTTTTPNGVPTGALNGWAGEPAAVRFARLAGENGYAARIIGAPAPSAAMGAQAIDTLGNLLQACEDADRGQIFEPRQALAIGYRTLASMYSQAPKLTLDYSAAEPGGADGSPDDSGLDPTYDDLLTRNDWTLTRSAGSGADGGTYQFQLNDGSEMSITGVGDYADTKSVNVLSDAQLPNVAGWMVHAGTVDEARWPVIPVNLARAEMASLYYTALDTDIGDHVQIVNAPDLVVYDPVDQIAFQVTEKLGGFHYVMEFNAVPELPYEVAIASTARADTAGSQLHTSYSSSAASFSVDVTAGNLWITTAGFPSMFPFDINVAGERITVTAITGSSTPQTFTVTRAVNGVSKAQAADAPVALWSTPVAAL